MPKHFAATDLDLDLALRLVAEHPLALLVGPDAAGESFDSHVPLVAAHEQDGWVLEGHMARANPHWAR